MNSLAFTLKAKTGILNVLKTDCGVSLPYDPKNGGEEPVRYKFNGLWDTGATCSVISKDVVRRLNLSPIGKVKAYNANGSCDVNTYLVNLYLPNNVAFSFVTVTEGVLNGTDILIGMDIITKGDFSVSNFKGKTCFSFRIPSNWENDFLKNTSATPYIKDRRPGRNDPCPCGSGKKYKNCCIGK